MRFSLHSTLVPITASLVLMLAACAGEGPAATDSASGSGSDSSSSTGDAGPELDVEPDPWLTQVYKPVQDQAEQMSVDDFLAEYPLPPMIDGVSYDALTAAGLPEISAFAGVGPDHEALLAQNGFVAVHDPKGYSFPASYHNIYYNDLPVLITSDSILHALHSSFDAILADLERKVMAAEITAMLAEMHGRLATDLPGLPEDLQVTGRDLDVYLTVGRTLMTGEPVATLTGQEATDEVNRILTAIDGLQPLEIELFGVQAVYDFSQMKPRGHYEDEELLQRYWRAMIWLGRTDMAMVTFTDAGDPVFNRRGVNAAFAANMLLTGSGADARWNKVNKVIETLVGERDSMGPQDMVQFMADTGIGDYEALAKQSDDDLFHALTKTSYGIQRIMSQIMYTDPTDPPLVLPRVYLLMGQRFTIDSYVFHNVTYDRVQDLRTGIKVTRMLPSELDVGFSLGNNGGAHHLLEELKQYGYQGILHEMRFLIDAHPADFWDKTFYNGWLAAIRSLSDLADFDQRPEAMRTRAWNDKTLNTQLASWAELRHDTLLYVKQSYSGGNGCEYPDAYVEPVPAFYDKMVHLGQLGAGMVQSLEADGYEVSAAVDFFGRFGDAMTMLGAIAHKELEGQTLSQAEFDFLRGAVEQEMVGCGEVLWDGWYSKLFYDPAKIEEMAAVIADVHTAPTDAAGNPTGWVLHGATGRPMLTVMTVQDCSGVRAYVGPSFSYHSVLTENFTRLADSEWREMVYKGEQPRPSWTASFTP